VPDTDFEVLSLGGALSLGGLSRSTPLVSPLGLLGVSPGGLWGFLTLESLTPGRLSLLGVSRGHLSQGSLSLSGGALSWGPLSLQATENESGNQRNEWPGWYNFKTNPYAPLGDFNLSLMCKATDP
jgi:hypothetical protein